MSELRQNLVTLVNSSNIRSGVELNGRQHIVVTSKTLPFDVEMNGIVYPKDEIEKTYHLLNDTPAPVGHPRNAAGEFISAKTQEGRNLSDIGAWNRNPRIVGNRVELETWIDIERAKLTAEGREVLDRIEKKEPISTSVAVLANTEEVNGKLVARIKEYDHNAILLNEAPAAGPDKGVGMFVNTADAISIHEPEKNLVEKVYNALVAKFKSQDIFVNEEEKEMEELQKKYDELKAKYDELVKSKDEKKDEKIEVNQALIDRLEKVESMLIANSEKELEDKRGKVAKILRNEEAVKDMNEKELDSALKVHEVMKQNGKTHNILNNELIDDNKELSVDEMLKLTYGE